LLLAKTQQIFSYILTWLDLGFDIILNITSHQKWSPQTISRMWNCDNILQFTCWI